MVSIKQKLWDKKGFISFTVFGKRKKKLQLQNCSKAEESGNETLSLSALLPGTGANSLFAPVPADLEVNS